MKRIAWLSLCAALALPAAASTEPPKRPPTRMEVTDALNRAAREASRVDRSDVRRQLDNVQQEATRSGGVNLDELVARHNQMAKNLVLPQRDVLRVFVSLSMPKDALIRVGRDTNRAGGKILFRGFHKDKLSEMHKAIQFMNEAGISDIDVDPESFRRYEIKHVPTYLVARVEESAEETPACSSAGSCKAGQFVAISGDVTLDYALERMRAGAPASFHASMNEYLRRLGR